MYPWIVPPKRFFEARLPERAFSVSSRLIQFSSRYRLLCGGFVLDVLNSLLKCFPCGCFLAGVGTLAFSISAPFYYVRHCNSPWLTSGLLACEHRTMTKPESPEFQKFDAAMSTILSVSHEELQRREAQWKKERKRKRPKRAKTSPASRVPAV